MTLPAVTLVITTYNWKEALLAVLHSVTQQNTMPSEVIVADDGSGADTREMLLNLSKDFPVPLIHSWQDDCGFRAARSRNKAIASAAGDYIIIIDGDMILPPTFIEDHASNATPNQFIQGGRVLLSNTLSQEVIEDNRTISFWTSGLKNRKNIINSRLLSRVFSRISNTDKSTRSCNMSFWKSDIIAVNGFNNDFVGWGREDSEFVVRLLNSGLNRLYLKFSGAGYHLYHNENSRDALPENDQILNDTIGKKLSYCKNGISEFLN
ncbi:glycosyltransferase family 2 protein [Vibrio ulleungensis]|uniref:Glycosyltransferase family 2 protein n=1 Tax=Vibrio ulleungensis TaxID=2807619 RepID=A0ABS2HLU9_9VIBR|nr:glycosyltransferase family 2 protein [Vibrio ulleungensis]MBM7037671.1 glycosyltransferase family 2 protein [Vibrio ulleungensis]